MNEVAIWVIIGILFMVAEIFTPSFFMFWFGIGGIVAAFVAYFYPNMVIEIVVFIAVSIVLVLLTRPFARRITGEEPRKINVDDIVGREAIVVEKIDNIAGKGIIKVNGDLWRATSESDDLVIEKEEKVVILRVEGAHLVVRRKEI